jgi:hypothetical protein
MAVMGGWCDTCSAMSSAVDLEASSVQLARKSSPRKALRGLRMDFVGVVVVGLLVGIGVVVGVLPAGASSTPT